MKEVAIKIGGEAGFGIKVSGLILAKTLFNMGFGIFGYSEYPSLIRGGHNTYQLNVSEGKVMSATKKVDILAALNKETVDLHTDELHKDSIIIHDGLKIDNSIKNIDIPLMDMAKKTGSELARNMAALGAILSLLGLESSKLNNELTEKFGVKGKEIVDMNKKAVRLGYDFVKKNNPQLPITNYQLLDEETKKLRNNRAYCNTPLRNKETGENKGNSTNDHLMTANEAAAHGIINGGCKLYAAYPMTPATSIMHVLAKEQRKHNLVVHQTEDEISAIGVAIGAASTGVRAATGTSGGGFCLMTESLGLAAITETPLVVINSQRTAPATGLPTWTEQGDLQFMIRASHGEFPRFVIAPGDAEEAFYMIQDGFNLAEKFQVPVIFLMDKMISESDFSMYDVDTKKISIKREGFLSDNEVERMADYKRYEFTNTGISKRAVPGQKGGVHIINSDDHDEYGFSTEESEMRTKMMDKRFKKLALMEAEIKEPVLYGPSNADLTVVGWGSVKGAALDAIQEYKNKSVNFLHISYIWPFPKKRVEAVLKKAKNILLVENNKTGQLGDLIREQTGIEIKNNFLKYDGRPFFREEVIREIKRHVR
ncbi:MAG: 2-oxoacid:acceptor oxidoreductase subunit alpha [Candidatus Kuenenbacteria bacterium]